MRPGTVFYIFLDESGDFDFSPSGSAYFTLTGLSTEDPYTLTHALHTLKHQLIETVHDREFSHFHAFNDPRPVRMRVLDVLAKHSGYRVDAVSFPKNVIHPPLRDPQKFYPHAARLLLKWIFQNGRGGPWSKVLVIADQVKLRREREAVLKSVKGSIRQLLPHGQRFDVWMHSSAAHPLLQAADYFSWVIARARNRGDASYRNVVAARISSDFLFYSRVRHKYY
ncbi:MAG TPA: DUF3800 domain-containing protein [Dehalococcoidia bacterium]|nr:DUF3800 domain-containing protein [Dehalococcoidia bacterium]